MRSLLTDRGPACYTKAARGERSRSYVCSLRSVPPARRSNRFTGSGRWVALHHGADCVQSCVESNRLGLRGLHAGVVHRIFKRRLTVGALVAHVAVELDLWACPKNKEKRHCINQNFTSTK